MKNKYFYPIFKLKAKSWIRYWLLKKTEFKGKLSEILTGFSFNLQNTLRQKFVKFEIQGHSIQDGEPSPENEVPIKSAGDNGSITDKIFNKNLANKAGDGYIASKGGITSGTGFFYTDLIPLMNNITNVYYYGSNLSSSMTNVYANRLCFYDENKEKLGTNIFVSIATSTVYTIPVGAKYVRASFTNSVENSMLAFGTATDYVPHEEQTYTIPVQAPFRSIGDVRDVFFKNTVDSPYYDENLVENGWYERHLPYIASYNNEVLPLDVYNEVGGIKYCNEKSMSTTGQFSTGASVQYLDESNWNCLLCTQSQIDILENIPSTFSGQTNVFSIDEVKAYLKIQYWESDTNG